LTSRSQQILRDIERFKEVWCLLLPSSTRCCIFITRISSRR